MTDLHLGEHISHRFNEELEEVLAHFVVNDGLTRHLFLLNRELI